MGRASRRFRQSLSRSFLLVAAFASGCKDPTGVARDLGAAEVRWLRSAPASYEFTFSRTCFCAPDAVRPVVIRVQDGRVASVRYVGSDVALPESATARYPSIAALFDEIERATRDKAERIDARFHPVLGYPVTVFIDYRESTADDESWFTVSDFRAL